MANDILFKEYTLTVDFEDRKSIDSRRKLQIKELYENCEIVKLGNFSIFKSFDRSGQFSSNGIILKDVDISILNKTANELEKIFSVKFEKKSNKISIESSYLIENKNINPNRISLKGYGEFNPIVPNDTPENKAKNRRVDILVVEERESKTENKNNNVENK